MSSREVAKGIVKREKAMREHMGITIHPGPADPAIYASTDGPSIADNMASEDVRWVRADNSRITGWQQMRERIWAEGEAPLLYVFNTCTELIRTLPAAPRDEHIADDIDTEFEDHALDETRYATMFKKREIFFGSSHG